MYPVTPFSRLRMNKAGRGSAAYDERELSAGPAR